MALSADEEMVVICTATGTKTVPSSDFDIKFNQNKKAPETIPSSGLCILCALAHNAAIVPAGGFIPTANISARAIEKPSAADRPIFNRLRKLQQARAPPSNA